MQIAFLNDVMEWQSVHIMGREVTGLMERHLWLEEKEVVISNAQPVADISCCSQQTTEGGDNFVKKWCSDGG